MKLSQEQQRRIEDCIEFRFYSSLRFSMITDWLRNFDDSEIDMAISILEHIDYYRTEDISSIMMNGLDKLLATKKKLHFVGIGEADVAHRRLLQLDNLEKVVGIYFIM